MDIQKAKSQDVRKWNDKKRFILPLLFLFPPAGILFMWIGNAFSKGAKVGLSIVSGLFFMLYFGGILSENKTEQVVDNNLPELTEMEAQEGTVQFNNNGEEVGRTQEEEGVEIKMTKISQKLTEGKKAVFEFRLSDRANKNQLISIANLIKEDHPGYERYFIGYYLPNQKVGKGSWATTHFNPDLEVNILGLTYSEYKTLINLPMEFKGKKIGKWLADYNIIIISKSDDGKYILTNMYKDGNPKESEIIKKGKKYIYENDFGEYYEIEKNGKLSHYTENGKFTEYEVIQ